VCSTTEYRYSGYEQEDYRRELTGTQKRRAHDSMSRM